MMVPTNLHAKLNKNSRALRGMNLPRVKTLAPIPQLSDNPEVPSEQKLKLTEKSTLQTQVNRHWIPIRGYDPKIL